MWSGKAFPDLLSCPRRGRMVGDIDMNDATAIVREDDEDEQDPEGCGWDGEEVHGGTLGEVRSQEGAPGR